jgi:hypothetical protein
MINYFFTILPTIAVLSLAIFTKQKPLGKPDTSTSVFCSVIRREMSC